jgi:hypothetical protein
MKEKDPDAKLIDAEILQAGSVDYLDIWFISGSIRRWLAPHADEERIKALVLDSLRRLLASGRIRAGELYPPGEFSPWPFDTEEAIATVREAWDKIDRPLQPGDIAYFEVVGGTP